MEVKDMTWRKANKSGNGGSGCVEIGTTSAGHVAGIRDSKSPERGHLDVTPQALAALLADVKAGRRDLLQPAQQPR